MTQILWRLIATSLILLSTRVTSSERGLSGCFCFLRWLKQTQRQETRSKLLASRKRLSIWSMKATCLLHTRSFTLEIQSQSRQFTSRLSKSWSTSMIQSRLRQRSSETTSTQTYSQEPTIRLKTWKRLICNLSVSKNCVRSSSCNTSTQATWSSSPRRCTSARTMLLSNRRPKWLKLCLICISALPFCTRWKKIKTSACNWSKEAHGRSNWSNKTFKPF